MAPATISGAVSGLDTATLINGLVSVQQNQQVMLQQQQAGVQKRSDALAALSTSLTALSSQVASLAHTSAWNGASATSSSTGVTATATGIKAASLTFDVASVAAAHTLVSSDALSSTSAQAASGPLTLTRFDGTTAQIDVGSGSLDGVVAGINNAGVGLVAAAVQTGPSTYRLQVASATTGSTSSFTLDGLDGFASMDTLVEGADATLHLGGTSAAAYDVTSSSNTFGSLVPGLSFTVTRPETGVTVSSTVDGSSIADQVNTLVNTTNKIISSIDANTAYDASTKTSGALSGDSTARNLKQQLLSTVSTVSAPGVQLTRDGQLTFDRQKFLDAFKADPAKVARAFGAAGSFTAASGVTGTSVSVSNALQTSRPGSYAVQVDTAPDRDVWQIDTGGAGLDTSTIALTRGTSSINYTVPVGQSLAETAAAFNAVSSAARFGVSAQVVDTALRFTADAVGTSSAFQATVDDAPITQTAVGTDIAGSIDGQPATGVGGVLSLPTGTGGAVGLSLAVTTTADDVAASGGAVGTMSYTPGLAQRLLTLVNDATNPRTGSLTTAQSGASAQVKRYQQDIDAWDDRLAAYRATLTTQFTAMETAMSTLKTQTSALSSLIAASGSSSSPSGTLNSG